MQISVISIGNSKGIRLSKTLIEKYKIKDAVEVILEKNQIVLKPASSPRKGWEKSFQTMGENGDDALIVPDVFDDETFGRWK